jgi:hypothetical protein
LLRGFFFSFPGANVDDWKMMTHEDVHSFAQERGILRVELCWIDLDQRWHTMTLPYKHDLMKQLDSSGAVWPAWDLLNEEQCVWSPDWSCSWSCPFSAIPTLSVLGFLNRTTTSGPQTHFEDARACAKRAEQRLLNSSAFQQAEFNFSGSFFVLQKDVDSSGSSSFSSNFDPRDWRPVSESYLKDFESEWGLLLERCGMGLKSWYPMKETGRVGFETGFRSLLQAADHWSILRRFAKNTAEQHGRRACFLPMPWKGQPGSEVTVSLKAKVAEDVRSAWISHIGSIAPFATPTSNSFRRLLWRMDHGWDSRGVSFAWSGFSETDSTTDLTESRAVLTETYFGLADGSMSAHLLLSALSQSALAGAGTYDSSTDVVLPTSVESAWENSEALNILIEEGVFLQGSLSLYKEKRLSESRKIRLSPHPDEWMDGE